MVFSILPTDLEHLAKEFYAKGISILDDGIVAPPEGAYENSPLHKPDRNIISHFRWVNFITHKHHHSQTHQLSNSSSESSGTSCDCTHSS